MLLLLLPPPLTLLPTLFTLCFSFILPSIYPDPTAATITMIVSRHNQHHYHCHGLQVLLVPPSLLLLSHRPPINALTTQCQCQCPCQNHSPVSRWLSIAVTVATSTVHPCGPGPPHESATTQLQASQPGACDLVLATVQYYYTEYSVYFVDWCRHLRDKMPIYTAYDFLRFTSTRLLCRVSGEISKLMSILSPDPDVCLAPKSI